MFTVYLHLSCPDGIISSFSSSSARLGGLEVGTLSSECNPFSHNLHQFPEKKMPQTEMPSLGRSGGPAGRAAGRRVMLRRLRLSSLCPWHDLFPLCCGALSGSCTQCWGGPQLQHRHVLLVLLSVFTVVAGRHRKAGQGTSGKALMILTVVFGNAQQLNKNIPNSSLHSIFFIKLLDSVYIFLLYFYFFQVLKGTDAAPNVPKAVARRTCGLGFLWELLRRRSCEN